MNKKNLVEVYLGLGSNLGDKEKNLQKAIALLEEKLDVLKTSPFYLTEPAYYLKQNTFVNAALHAQTHLSPQKLLKIVQSIEARLGRKRHIRYGPRTIDIDILFYGNEIISERELQIPHPLLQERWFVLKPLCDLNPALIHSVLQKSVAELLEEIERKENILKDTNN